MLSALLGLLGALVYGSFLEWALHRYVMHTPKISKLAFKRHAVQHHAYRRAPGTFYIPTDETFIYKLGEDSFMPVLWLLHIPLYYLIGRYVSLGAGIGVAVGCGLYLVAYELIHLYVHMPKNYRFQRTRLFRLLCEYHRVHHQKARKNYNVVLPLADLILGTLSFEEMTPEPSAPEFMPQDRGPGAVIQSWISE
jgi:sterol desaturase/sphingolipid hydroxylase (fatty acid hydroxylase superfamily)